ncbi:TOMM precursor leader peptide-binding protein [Pseudodesulfovibrio sp. F-1]|uniref:TOMM leader peptide-binding protein n=1 Tax=Pseudodesulfovibrio alkaliphilus TaxID=2661613 RepID=A0A7K1KRV2_9BACT|nr:TOMM precursor leader peptide-binding protein [Pseudodesulfovibrio alkaliphilus]MUM78833.1 TOMM precursor leader peptide-binding protein [Pseudodesulfovibrio alkaliphilus]
MQNKNIKLPLRPKLSVSYHVIGMDDDRVQFRNGQDLFVIKGPGLLNLVHTLFPLLTGELTVEEILAHMDEKHPPEAILKLLHRLVQRRVVRDAINNQFDVPGVSEFQKAYFSQFTHRPKSNLTALAKSRVTVLGLGPLGASVAEILARSGVGSIEVSDEQPVTKDDLLLSAYSEDTVGITRECAMAHFGEKTFPTTTWSFTSLPSEESPVYEASDYMIVCLENYRPDILDRVNDFSLAYGTPYTWCCLDSLSGTVGPTVLPHETACFNCYRTRVNANADYPEELQVYEDQLMSNGNSTVFGYLPPHIQILSGLVSLEVIKDLSGLTPPLTYNAQLEINLLNMEFALHSVLKLPRCTSCGRHLSSGAPVRPFDEMEA